MNSQTKEKRPKSWCRALSAGALLVPALALHCERSSLSFCEQTLSCDASSPAFLDANCQWRLANGRSVEGGPQLNAQGVWVWPDGVASLQQDYVCGLRPEPTPPDGGVRAIVDAQVVPPPVVEPDGGPPDGGSSAGVDGDAGAQTPVDAGREEPATLCVRGARRFCGPSTANGRCRRGIQVCSGTAWGTCFGAVFAEARDCGSTADNDCDGLPDNTLDEVCQCAPNTVGVCDEHEGLDGEGPCQAGERRCEFGDSTGTSTWGECRGAVGPSPQDSCSVPGDDADCSGEPNSNCACVDGEVQPCGPEEVGVCRRGSRTCFNQQFGECEGQVVAGTRDCSSSADNDCDGRPDNSLDQDCRCAIGEERSCEAHPGLDGNAQCRAGSQRCVGQAGNQASAFDECIGSVGPMGPDSCVVLGSDLDCSGSPNTGCECIGGEGNLPCSSNPRAARCSAAGACVPCQGSADCSLVAGLPICVAGECVARVEPPPVPPLPPLPVPPVEPIVPPVPAPAPIPEP